MLRQNDLASRRARNVFTLENLLFDLSNFRIATAFSLEIIHPRTTECTLECQMSTKYLCAVLLLSAIVIVC